MSLPRIYYMPRTRSVRVLWALHELGAPFSETRLAPEDRRSDAHLTRHPLGRVPALELADGTIMFESAAILLALADEHPDAGLSGPLRSSRRALVYQWLIFGMTELEGPLYRFTADVRAGTESAAQGRDAQRFNDAATALAAALGDSEWLVDDRFSVADIVCVGVLGSAESRGALEPWPALRAYVARGEARPAYRAAVAHGA
jgi:glutathione S-transferase